MPFEFDELIHKRKHNPSWKLMAAENAPLIISFLDRVFRERNLRQLDEQELIIYLDDYLYELREGAPDNPFPKRAQDYLEDWTVVGRDWLRKFYPQGSDIPHYDLTPASERVLQWIDTLYATQFIGTESRLYTCLDLLSQIVQGVEKDKDTRIAELQEKKQQIEDEIKHIESGNIPIMNQRQIRERFMQFRRTAKELLSDFRAVEQYFRELDREIRENIATWSGEKGELLEQFFGEHDSITQSEEGQSFQAFWNFIMSPYSQEELSKKLDKVFQIDELGDLRDDPRLKRIHFDWISAGEQTQRTVARLSKQLRRYLDDRAFWENKRIVELFDSIESKAVRLKHSSPVGSYMEISDTKCNMSLLMEQTLFSIQDEKSLVSKITEIDDEEVDTDKLFNLVYVDRERLQRTIDAVLTTESQVSLAVLLQEHPLQQGLSELVTYMHMAEQDPYAFVYEQQHDSAKWYTSDGVFMEVAFPRIIFCKRSSYGSK